VILDRARKEAEALIAEANRTIENTIRTIRESQADKELTRLARKEFEGFADTVVDDAAEKHDDHIKREMERLARRRERREERRMERERGVEPAPKAEEVKPVKIEVGSKVKIEGQDVPGVVQMIKGKKAQVAFGQMMIMVEMERLKAVSSAEYREATRPTTARTVVSVDINQRKLNFRDHIDVRGMRASEALAAVEDLVDDALMVGVETRSSSPVRLLRDKTYQSNIRGLYPCGEGAGYAGGIVSAAVDGIRVAEAVAAPLEG
jgi:DNA mismatch repair protein MutS2